MKKTIKTFSLLSLILFFWSCQSESGSFSDYEDDPSASEKMKTDEENAPENAGSFSKELHRVVADEVLPAKKYVYIKVTEGEKQYWVATAKKEITVGDTYYFQGGLLKLNFESKEYDRVFDRLYLVTKFISENHSNGADVMQSASGGRENPELTEGQRKSLEGFKPAEGSISIASIVDNPEKYEGETVQVSGVCVKINPNIMKRNWIHLKDGSKDDYDFVVTSDLFFEEGAILTLEATVALNKDFGSGYTYDLILENGVLVK